MFKFISGLPADVLGVEAAGTITHEDYRDVLIPKVEAMMGKRPLKMIYVIGKAFTGFKFSALWDDTKLGLRHWRDFSRIAFVCDHAMLNATVAMFRPFFHGEFRSHRLSELPEATAWITGVQDNV